MDEQSLQVMTRDVMPMVWAQSMMNLADAYRSHIRGDRAQNIEAAIDRLKLPDDSPEAKCKTHPTSTTTARPTLPDR